MADEPQSGFAGAYPDPGDESVPGDPVYRSPGGNPEFARAEYESVRTDLLQGLSGQQSILAWSIAAIGVVFAAGITISPSHLPHAVTLREAAFGVAIPVVALGASIAWLGEIFRHSC